MTSLKLATMAWIDKAKLKGMQFSTHTCPHCESKLETPQPTKKEVTSKGYWESMKTCYECGKPVFVKTWPTGKTEVVDPLQFKATHR